MKKNTSIVLILILLLTVLGSFGPLTGSAGIVMTGSIS